MRSVRLPVAIVCVCITAATGAFAQSTVTLNATSGTGSISTNYTTGAGLTLDLGFFAEYLVVGGGGSGGTPGGSGGQNTWGTGGGGAGGMLTGTTQLFATSYGVTVGGGGAAPGYNASSTTQGNNGANSVFATGTAVGGGGGGGGENSNGGVGANGGSGGGGGSKFSNAGGTGTSGQGNNGGNARNGNTSTAGDRTAGGGGGGAGATGGTPANGSSVGGNGGNGLASTITGSSVTYAGGGGGGARDAFGGQAAGSGGSGGGGAGSTQGTAGNGTDGLGGGGGGRGADGVGGQGGSGLVIVRYQGASLGNIGGTVTSGSGSAVGYTLHTFSTTGTTTASSALNLSGVNMGARLATTLTGTLSGSGGLTFAGPGRLTLSASNSFTGDTRITSGTLTVGHANALRGSTLDMNAGDSGAITFAQNSTLGGLTGSRNLANGGNTLTIGGNSATTTYYGALSGSGGLTKHGSGGLTLAGANTYSGPTVISGGTLAVGAGGSIAQSGTTLIVGGNLAGDASSNGLSGALVIDGGNVSARDVYIANSMTNPRSATGVLNVSSGTLSAAGNLGVGTVPTSAYSYFSAGSGTLNVLSGGVVDVRGAFVSGDKSTFNVNGGGTLKIGGGAFLTSGSTAAVNDGTIVLDATSFSYFRGSITGTGAVIKSGGRLNVEGALGSTGGLTISSGTVVVIQASLTGSIAGDVVNNDVLEFTTFNRTNRTFAGAISGSGQLISSGYGASLTLTGSNTFTGLTQVLTTSGTLSVGNGGTSGSLTGGVVLASNALVFNRSDASTYGGNITGNGSLTKLGAGALTLTGSSTFTGQTTVSSGTLVLGSGNALGSSAAVVVASGATLQATQPIRIGYIDSSGTVLGSENLSATLTVTNSGLIGGIANGTDSQGAFAAGIVKLSSGTSTVNAVNTYTGRTWVRAGTLATGLADAFAGASDLTVEAGAAFDRGSFSQTFANADINGTVGNAGEGGGLLTVTGTLSGSGVVNGATLVNGFHAPGNSPGVQTFNDDLTYGNAAAIGWELMDNTQSNSPVVYDQIVLTGLSDLAFSGANVLSLSFNGAGSLVNWNDTFWNVNRVWTVFDLASGVTTGFNNLSLGGSLFDSNGLLLDGATRGFFSLGQSGQDVVLNFTAVPEPSTWVMALAGVAVGYVIRRRRGR